MIELRAGGAELSAGRANPFPGLRPFEQHESALYFGRDEQCDDLLSRLARRRLVAVVGMSGSGKSSLVRAGLLPALDRGYMPSAGSSWHVAVFRPGSDPLANMSRALAARRMPGGAAASDSPAEIRKLLDASSLGLVGVARQMLTDPADSLLVVADQFEELFRFRRITPGRRGRDEATACVDLLVNASQQDDVPVYIVLTMRSDYLGDCAEFTGLPEALNDSQFLVPRMTRAQLRAAIESPAAVYGGRITSRLLQRLLYDVERRGSLDVASSAGGDGREQDQLPVLQHALMRVWSISDADRLGGEAVDLRHYEEPPVETLEHALDRHAEEVYHALPTSAHRDAARLIFQQLTDRDAANRDVRRPTPLHELVAVARGRIAGVAAGAEEALVNDVVAAFAAEGRAFLIVNVQGDVDISHESLIRNWERLRAWLQEENRSRRIYVKLTEAAASWEDDQGSVYRGPELAEARRWSREQKPTEAWARRYDERFDLAQRFLNRSVRSRLLRRGLVIANLVILIAGAIAIAVLMGRAAAEAQRAAAEAQRAEVAALEARNATAAASQQIAESNENWSRALQAEREGRKADSADYARRAEDLQKQAASQPVLTPSEVLALESARKQMEAARASAEAERRRADDAEKRAESLAKTASGEDELRRQLAEAASERERLQKALSSSEGEAAQLKKEVASLTRKPPPPDDDRAQIEQLLLDYGVAYASMSPAAVLRVMPFMSIADLTRDFGQYETYRVDLIKPVIAVKGDSATVTASRRITAKPKVGVPLVAADVRTVFHLQRTRGGWIIASVQ